MLGTPWWTKWRGANVSSPQAMIKCARFVSSSPRRPPVGRDGASENGFVDVHEIVVGALDDRAASGQLGKDGLGEERSHRDLSTIELVVRRVVQPGPGDFRLA